MPNSAPRGKDGDAQLVAPYFCDVALLVTCIAIWMESPLLVSMQAVAITLPQMLWVIDLLCRLVAARYVSFIHDRGGFRRSGPRVEQHARPSFPV